MSATGCTHTRVNDKGCCESCGATIEFPLSVSAPAQEVKRYDMDRLLNAAWVSGAKVGANCIEADNRKALNEAISAHTEGACGKDYVLFSAYASLSAQLAAAKQELADEVKAQDEALAIAHKQIEALESTNTVLRSALKYAMEAFKWLDVQGGLGYEKHEQIRECIKLGTEALAALQGETK